MTGGLGGALREIQVVGVVPNVATVTAASLSIGAQQRVTSPFSQKCIFADRMGSLRGRGAVWFTLCEPAGSFSGSVCPPMLVIGNELKYFFAV